MGWQAEESACACAYACWLEVVDIATGDTDDTLRDTKWGCSSVVERSLCMREAPGSIPGTSIVSMHFGVIRLFPSPHGFFFD